jgi:RND family efflux transporter MFP subunit
MTPLTFLHAAHRHSRPLVASLLMAACVATAQAQSPVLVPTTKVQTQVVGSGFEWDGVIQPVKQSTVSAQSAGRIERLLVKAGDKVRAGQLLATIDDRDAQTGVQRSQAQVAQAQAELRNAQAHFERTRELLRQGFVSSAALDAAEAQLKATQAARDQAQAGARQASLYSGFTKVTAPFDAWVLQTLAESGDLAVPGKPLLSLYAPKPLRAVVQVPVSRSAALVAVAQQAGAVEVQLSKADGSTQWVRPIRTTQVPNADPVSQTVEWRLDLPDAEVQSALPGQQVRIRFAAGQLQRLVVPQAAVLYRGELTAVYVAAAKGFVLKVVRLGQDHGSAGVEVLSGLVAGDVVALDPVRAGLMGAQPQTSAK